MRHKALSCALFLLGISGKLVAEDKKWVPPNFIRELRYTCYPDKRQDLIDYFTRLAEADLKVNSGRMRWMEGQPYGMLVVAGIPAHHLEEYDRRPSSGSVFTRAFGEEEYRKYSSGYSNAQMRTESVIRRYREDLSLNRSKHLRQATSISRWTYFSVKPGKASLFEQAAARVIAAYRQIAPEFVMSGSQTIAGGGPQYLFVAPFPSYAALEDALLPEAAVEKAFGKMEAAAWNRMITESVERSETVIMQKVGKNSFVP